MPLRMVPDSVIESIEAVLDYNEADESTDYEAEHGPFESLDDAEESHVYTHMQRIRAWLVDDEGVV